MQHIKDPLFRTIFDQLTEPRLILQPDSPNFTVIAANTAYVQATGYGQDELTGSSIWNFFKADAAGSSTATIFQQGLNDVLRHKTAMKLPIFRFDTLIANKTAPRWWQVELLPVLDETGEIIYVTCTTYNVTIHVQDQATIMEGRRSEAAMLVRQQQVDRELANSEEALHSAHEQEDMRVAVRTKELSDSEYRLTRIVEVTPSGLCMLKGANLVIDLINKPMLSLWGRAAKQVLNKPLLTALPELQDQPFLQLAQQVLATGKTTTITEQPVIVIRPDGKPHTIYADFGCDPLFDAEGKAEAVLVTFNEVTALVNAQHLLQQRQEELETMNEEMNAANEELQAINEELTSANEELKTARQDRK